MDEILALYQKGRDFEKNGKIEDAAIAYKRAFDIVDGPDAQSRRILLASRIAALYWTAGKDSLASPWFEASGQKLPKREIRTMPFNKALRALQGTGRLTLLTAQLKKNLISDFRLRSEEDINIVPFLQSFYSQLPSEALKDGFIHHDWKFGQETDDAPTEFAELIGGDSPLLKQIGYHPSKRTDLRNPPNDLIVERKNGDRLSVPVEGLDDIVTAFNQELDKNQDQRRFVAMTTDGDWHAYFLLNTESFKTLCLGKLPALPCESIPGVEQARWLNQVVD